MRTLKIAKSIAIIMGALIILLAPLIAPYVSSTQISSSLVQDKTGTRSQLSDEANKVEREPLSAEEKLRLKALDESLVNDERLELLKGYKLLGEFLDTAEKTFKETENYKELKKDLERWGISDSTTIKDLQAYTIDYLQSKGETVKFGTSDFDNYVRELFASEKQPLAEEARSNPAFGKAYVYLSFYYTNIVSRDKSGEWAIAAVARRADNSLAFTEEALNTSVNTYLEKQYQLEFRYSILPNIFSRYWDRVPASAKKSFAT